MTPFLKAGQLLKNGKIEIIDLLGAGGIGQVYRAAMLGDGQRKLVAVKCFDAEMLHQFGVEAVHIVHRESLSVSRIQHPAVVKIHSIDLDSKFPFIVEELLEGGDLCQAIAMRKLKREAGSLIFSALELATMGHQICAGIMLLHQENQYHGDIKPNNLCFRHSDQNQIVIVDFGQSGFLEGNLLDRNETLATLPYLPPERTGFVKMAGNANSDLYSLGVTLYEAAVGQVPFTARDGRELVNRLLFEVPKPLHEIFPGFPLALSDIVSKLLRKNPQDRYHSAFGLSADFERCLQALNAGKQEFSFALGTKDKLRELNYRIPLVGRDREMAHLHSLFAMIQNNQSSLAFIGAPSGTGKSRLAFEILHRARGELCYISYVKFSQYESNLPLSAITLLLVEHAHYLKTMSPKELGHWQATINTRLGSRARLIAERFSCYEGLIPHTPIHSAADQSADFEAFNQCLGEFLALLAANRETQLVLIDDLQWADWQSLQVLGILAKSIWDHSARGIMLMGTFRSNEVHAEHPINKALLDNCPAHNLVELGPLDRSASNRLVTILLEEKGPEIEKLQDITYRFTAGNPFYIYEYLKSAIHTGIFFLEEATKTWHFNPEQINQAKLSAGVAGLVADRIRTLSPIGQALVCIASLSGHAMNRGALLELLPLLLQARNPNQQPPKAEDLDQSIELAYQGLLQKNLLAPDANCFRFFHDKIQESAYSLLSDQEKILLHPAYGLWCVADIQSHKDTSNEAQIFEAAYHLCKGNRRVLSAPERKFLFEAAKCAQNIFSYDKAKDYLNAIIEALDAQSETELDERFEVWMMLANTLCISDQLSDAMKLYDKLLEFDCTPLQRATIYCKKCEFALNLLDYKQTREASAAGLKSLGISTFTKESSAYLYILFFVPLLVIYTHYFKYFGKQTKEVKSDEDKIRFLLILKNEISQYFTSPIAAIANLTKLNFELMSYKDSDIRATLIVYWGVCVSSFGLSKIGRKLFARAYEYFDRTANPVDKGFTLFTWGFVCDMPSGDLLGAQKKLDEAVRTLAPLGESFWRSLSLMGLILIDYYGGETREAGLRSFEFIQLWNKVRFAATGLGTTFRHFMEEGQDDQVAFVLDQTMQAEQKISSEGYESIDSIYGLLSVGEYHETQGNYALAADYARRACWIGVLRHHRMSYAANAPIVYARNLIHQKRHFRAIAPLVICWINQLLNVRLFLPQTFFVTGYWLHSLAWKRSGRRLMEAGIDYANKRQWGSVVAEGSMLLGRLQMDHRPELAWIYLRAAKSYFSKRNWRFTAKQCDQLMGRLNLTPTEDKVAGVSSQGRPMMKSRLGSLQPQQIELKPLRLALLKLSAMSEKEPLFSCLMESLCEATASDFGLIILKDGEQWLPKFGYNFEIQAEATVNGQIDSVFLNKSIEKQSRMPVVRSLEESKEAGASGSASAMMVPLIYEARIYGYCYLASNGTLEHYNQQSVEIAAPIAIQGAITLHKISLNNDLAIERDQLSQLHRVLEKRVMEQTRDIKSILQHIKIGICTVSGPGISINRDYSLFLEQVLGATALQERALLPLLLGPSHLGEDERDQAKNAVLASLNEPEFAFFMNEQALPRTLRSEKLGSEPFVLELDWIPIIDEHQTVERLLLTINDVTALRFLEEQANQKSQELLIISDIISSRDREWLLFISSCINFVQQNAAHYQELVAGLPAEPLLRKMFINLHTIKGNARALGYKLINETIHGMEQYFAQAIRSPREPIDCKIIEKNLAAVADIIDRYRVIAEGKLGRSKQTSNFITLSRESLLAFYGLLESRALSQKNAINQPLNAIRDALFFSVSGIFQQLFLETQNLARDFGKSKPEIRLDMPHLWVTEPGEKLLRHSFFHLLHNALAHSIETAAERQSQGKPPEGLIDLRVCRRAQSLEFRIMDDGRGLDLAKLRANARDRGLLSDNQSQNDDKVASLLFAKEFGHAEALSEVSTPGPGMAVVAQYIEEAGGSIHIEFLEEGQARIGFRSFSFVIALPLALFHAEPNLSMVA